MATSSTVDIPSTLLSRVSEFRMSKRSSGSAAITISIDKKKLCMGIEEEHDSVTLEDLEEGELGLQQSEYHQKVS